MSTFSEQSKNALLVKISRIMADLHNLKREIAAIPVTQSAHPTIFNDLIDPSFYTQISPDNSLSPDEPQNETASNSTDGSNLDETLKEYEQYRLSYLGNYGTLSTSSPMNGIDEINNLNEDEELDEEPGDPNNPDEEPGDPGEESDDKTESEYAFSETEENDDQKVRHLMTQSLDELKEHRKSGGIHIRKRLNKVVR